jgi:RNA polymerase sigma-70 factor, ECF subfamily
VFSAATAAFEALVEKYQQPVMNLVYRMLGDLQEAEDLCQNVFVQVHKSAHRYRVTARFSTWLYTIARNLGLNELRRRSRHPAESLDASPPKEWMTSLHHQLEDHHPQPTRRLPPSELEQRIEQALAALPENQRTAILLCRQQDLSYDQIAEILGCSVSATKSLIHRARESLRLRLKPYLRTGGSRNGSRRFNGGPSRPPNNRNSMTSWPATRIGASSGFRKSHSPGSSWICPMRLYPLISQGAS